MIPVVTKESFLTHALFAKNAMIMEILLPVTRENQNFGLILWMKIATELLISSILGR